MATLILDVILSSSTSSAAPELASSAAAPATKEAPAPARKGRPAGKKKAASDKAKDKA